MTALQNKRLTKQVDALTGSLARAKGIFEYSLKELGDRIRRDMIIPTCKKHDLEFYSDGSVFFFVRGEIDIPFTAGYSLPDDEAHKIFMKANLDYIYQVLESEVLNNRLLGYYVSEVRKDDIK